MNLQNLYQADSGVQISALGEEVLTAQTYKEGLEPRFWENALILRSGTSYGKSSSVYLVAQTPRTPTV